VQRHDPEPCYSGLNLLGLKNFRASIDILHHSLYALTISSQDVRADFRRFVRSSGMKSAGRRRIWPVKISTPRILRAPECTDTSPWQTRG
jgi:hypothetical protein